MAIVACLWEALRRMQRKLDSSVSDAGLRVSALNASFWVQGPGTACNVLFDRVPPLGPEVQYQ